MNALYTLGTITLALLSGLLKHADDQYAATTDDLTGDDDA
jgi:hypothetical protein